MVAAGEVVFGMAVVADVTEGVEAEMVDGVEHGEELVLALEGGVADDAEVGNFEIVEGEAEHAAVAAEAGAGAGADAVVLAAASIEVWGPARDSTEGVPGDVKHGATEDEQEARFAGVSVECVKALPRNEFVEGGSAAPRDFGVDGQDSAKDRDSHEVGDLKVSAVEVDEVLVVSGMVGDEDENVDWNVVEGLRDALMFGPVGV